MNNYYDIGDILTDGQKLPCKFEINVPGLGYLQGAGIDDITENTKIELPFWMAELLAISQISPDRDESFISLLQPPFLSNKVLNSLKTDSVSLDIRQQSSVFFGLAERWLAIFSDFDLANTFSQSLLRRAVAIADVANSRAANSEQSEFLAKLDEFELKLYKATHEASKDMKTWLTQTK